MKLFSPGNYYELSFTFSQDKVRQFAELTGDINPLHIDPEYAATHIFGRPIVHGMFVASLISRVLGMHFPGEGTIYVSQELRFTAPVFTEDTVRVHIEVLEVKKKGRLRLRTRAFRDDDIQVVDGEAMVIAPSVGLGKS